VLTRVRTVARPGLGAVCWAGLRPFRSRLERADGGGRLRPGISAVVVARNEDYTVGMSLRSLIGFADQIICVDNGSDDGTLVEMEKFRDEHGGDADVDVVSMPGALLGDCRNEGLRRSRHQWHLRWDADMVAQTAGPDSMLNVRERALADARPRAIHMRRTTLIGDLRHAPRLGDVVDAGENWLIRAGHGITYAELGGMYDEVRTPLHYVEKWEPGEHIFHLAGLKADDNLIHRLHYFAWRELINREGPQADPELQTLDAFKRHRNRELFGTTDPQSVKFRYRRQLSYHLMPYDPEHFGSYPEVLRRELSGQQRFEVVYREGRPWSRIDRQDAEMLDYEPTGEDLEWNPEAFLRRFLTESDRNKLGIAAEGAQAA